MAQERIHFPQIKVTRSINWALRLILRLALLVSTMKDLRTQKHLHGLLNTHTYMVLRFPIRRTTHIISTNHGIGGLSARILRQNCSPTESIFTILTSER